MRLHQALLAIPVLAALVTGGAATAAAAPAQGAESVAAPARVAPAECGAGTAIKFGEVKSLSHNTVIGWTYLLRSGYEYWACVEFRSNLAEGYWGMARLHMIDDGLHIGTLHCDFPTGNGHVTAGDNTCYTSRSYAPFAHRTFIAEGDWYRGLSTLVGRGTTGPSTR
ncbi:hypothetical protein Kfla_2169 [Kribbella flavida DSM 17836]|uniref:Uncharacterized protein n=1 Tax=Kribbella flavida (strain DSM 17836 / JCM 10339 / NBRC 14399) TaxID=479435 RepID=D2PSC6_KRIFD|nr:hypothetical protein [Kribbella flavida]ADB31250.1 hypothetical protein Kfla_2169 [Kribbella flavida DSM 17836]